MRKENVREGLFSLYPPYFFLAARHELRFF
jgi:hypothetical protein